MRATAIRVVARHRPAAAVRWRVAWPSSSPSRRAPPAQVTIQELLDGLKADGSRWLTFGGNYSNQRYSPLTQITPENVTRLRAAVDVPDRHARQFRDDDAACATTSSTSPVRRTWRGRSTREPAGRSGAIAASCRHGPDRVLRPGQPRLRRARRQAVHDDARCASAGARHEDRRHRLGRDAGRTTRTATPRRIAPLVVKDKVIVGVAGGEYGIRGFIDAYDAQTGKRAWRLLHHSRTGRAGQQHLGGRFVEARRRRRVGDRRVRPRAESASTSAPATRAPTITARAARATTSIAARCVALDADTGKLKWHYQFTPHDVHDWDATEVPILADLTDRRPAAQGA